jgi:alpha-beta hydrolase superfamily lysophospholipase
MMKVKIMMNTSGKFQAAGPIELFYQTWLPEDSAKAILVICHGVGEHSGRYMNLVHPLTQRQIAVWTYDHRGCGSSPGQRGHIDSWEDFRSGLVAFLELVRAENPGLPVFLYGHSMGALIVLDYIQSSPEGLQGAVLSSAPIDPAGVAKPLKVLVARLLSRLRPTHSIELGLDPDSLSRDPQVVQAYKDDPLVQGLVSVRWGTEALSVQDRTRAHPHLIRLPVLFIHGENDPLHLVNGVRSFFEKIQYPDKQLLVYEGSLHEPHNDLEHETVARDLADWLERRLSEIERSKSFLESG